MKKAFLNKCCAYGLWGVILFAFYSAPALAGPSVAVDDVAKNIVSSAEDLPGFISALAYMLALLFGVTGILKLIEHVGNPQQAPLRVAVIRFIIGGALLALPTVYGAMAHAINGGTPTVFDPAASTLGGFLSRFIGSISNILPTFDFNGVLQKINEGIEELPGAISAVAYLLGLVMGFVGLLKIKEHVENPDKTPLREGVIRLLIGGALFAIPTVYDAMYNAIGGPGGVGQATSIFGAFGMLFSAYGQSACDPSGGFISLAQGLGNMIGLGGGPSGAKIGDALCNLVTRAGAFPAFLTGIGYLIGLVLGIAGLLKIKAHVLDPSRTSVWEGIARLLAGGAFFALPAIIEVVKNTVTPLSLMIPATVPVTQYNEATGSNPCTGLDGMVYCMMDNVFTPMHVVINFFTFCAGTILIMIGISRLIKGTQDGAKGPGGFGTIMTFVTGGMLISYNQLMRAATGTFFGSPVTQTFAKLNYNVNTAETAHMEIVVGSVIKFMILVGLISFVRGIFIIRGVAEGNNQASLMAGITHMVGGALAVNLGPLINAVEATLGIGTYGIAFS